MNYFLLFLSAALGCATSLVSRVIKKDSGKISVASISNAATFFVAFAMIFLFGVFSNGRAFFSSMSRVPFFLAALYGIAMMTAQFLFLLAVGRGPVSVSTLFYSCGFIIPTFWGILRFHEPVSVLAVVGVVLVLCSFVLSTESKGDKKKADFLWCVFAVSAAVCSGLVGVTQKEFAAISPCPLDTFLFVAFAFSVANGAAFAVACSFVQKGKGEKVEKADLTRSVLAALPLGAIMGGTNKLNSYLAGVFESIVFFPGVNGGRILLTAVLSAWIFREKTSLRQKIAVGIGFLGILFISI